MKSPRKLDLPEFEFYYQGTSGVDRPNALRFISNGISYWFSYQTLVAFYSPKTGRVVHENVWSKTTGRHLNVIDGGNKAARVNAERFAELLEVALS